MAALPQASSASLGKVNWGVALDRLFHAFITSEASSTSKWNKNDAVVRCFTLPLLSPLSPSALICPSFLVFLSCFPSLPFPLSDAPLFPSVVYDHAYYWHALLC